ncbi:endochitinase EP3-like [Zingiber officinale]|uniref:chitinase n=1 Tax=Zingiber officinale TaxID=94328 RepID=A0A8J5G9F4_ZINOF|nr:endochitinase EP3-like [Zingiber officinale]KAG6498379.1 hypothetical protein ZIOFF_046291 [Zingiber officinale]
MAQMPLLLTCLLYFTGCQEGPYYSSPNDGDSVADIVTKSFFDDIVDQAHSGCAGREFYSRNAFLTAAVYYPDFGGTGSADDARREIAAFFAHVTHETGHFCYIEEIDGASLDYCDTSRTDWPCVSGHGYYGRGPLQLSWNYNYGAAGQAIGFDGLGAPEMVADDDVISFRTALWYWMNNCHSRIISGEGFGSTIRAINSIECDGGNTPAVNARVRFYTDYCSQFGVDPGNNLCC